MQAFLGDFPLSAYSISAVSPATIIARKSKEEQQLKRNYYLALDSAERRLIIESLNNLRSRLIAAGRYTDAVDELLIKFVNAKSKKLKVIYTV